MKTKNLVLSLVLLFGASFGFAQEQTMEASSPVYNFDLGFAPADDIDLDFDFDLEQMAQLGKDYALIIAVQDYDDKKIKSLDQPVPDAQSLKDALTRYYTFSDETTKLVVNATKSQILEALEEMAKKISANDNLLIFYAGHGEWDKQLEIGYWLPSDANKDDRATWFSNSILRDYIKGIKSKHTLLIADACFSGGIFKTRSLDNASIAVQELYSKRSRKAMTSGTLTEVPDKSVFIQYLVRALKRNKEVYLPAGDLFYSFKNSVINNSANQQIPQFGEISGTGNEGGDFIFKRKR